MLSSRNSFRLLSILEKGGGEEPKTMAKVNRQLVLKVANDLMTLQKVVQDLAGKVGLQNPAPRRPPNFIAITKPTVRFLRRQSQKKDVLTSPASDCAQYVLLLELIYDRSQAMARLFLHWLSQLSSYLEDKQSESFEMSHSTGLGDLFGMLSNSTQRFADLIFHTSRRCCLHSNKCRKAEESSAEEYRCERSTQASSALWCCESCREMQQVIKGIVKSLRMQLGDFCHTARTRTKVRAQLSTLSQLGATHRLVDAVNKDICALLDCVAEATASASIADRKAAREAETRTGLQLILQETEKLLQDTDRNASIAQSEVAHLKTQILEIQKRVEEERRLREEEKKRAQNQLAASMVTIRDIGAELANQRSTALQKLSETQITLQQVKAEKTASVDDLKDALHREKCLKSNLDLERSLNERLKEELKKESHTTTERAEYIPELENKILHLSEVLNEVSNNNEVLKVRLSESIVAAEAIRVRAEEERKLKQAECDDLRENLRAMADHEALLIRYPDFHGPLERCEAGDPVIDMESQVRANELRVRLLNEQTARLRVTLEKLRRLTSTPQRSTNDPLRPPKTAPAAQWASRNASSSDDDDCVKKIHRSTTRFHPHSWSD